jgi:prophage antirepressor-like protein/transcriptional regulator with XRE-family HTH domain
MFQSDLEYKDTVTKYEIIQREFEGSEIEFIRLDGEIWITAKMLGLGLEYADPRRAILKLFYRNQEEIDDFSTVVTLGDGSTQQEIRAFNETGAYLLVMFSKQPKAKEFRRWLANVAKEIRKKGYYVEENKGLRENPVFYIKNTFIKITKWISHLLDDIETYGMYNNKTREELPSPEKIRHLRNELNLTQSELEQETGIPQSTISRIENEMTDPPYHKVKKIYEFLYEKFKEKNLRENIALAQDLSSIGLLLENNKKGAITVPTRTLITKAYKKINEQTGITSQEFYNSLRDEFEFESIDEISEEKALEILDHLETNFLKKTRKEVHSQA